MSVDSGTAFHSLYSHGFARVAAAVPHVRLGDPEYNAQRTLELAGRASDADAALVIFPELGISGYAIDDLLHQHSLTDAVLAAIGTVAKASAALSPVIVVGAPLYHEWGLFNTAVVIHRGQVLGVVPKSYLPEYREYYEKRQFRAARDAVGTELALLDADVPFGPDLLFAGRDLPAFTLHVEICEDLWTPIPPSTYGAMAGATVLANLSASNITIGKADYRRALCASQSARDDLRLRVHGGRARRVDHRSGLGRTGVDLRERRPAGRVRALFRRRAADPRRPRPRPDRGRPGRYQQLRRLNWRPSPSAGAGYGGSSSTSAPPAGA